MAGTTKVNKTRRAAKARARKSEVRMRSMLARGEAEIVYRPTHYAPTPLPGVVLSGTRSEGRVTSESKDEKLWGKRNSRKTDAAKRVHNKRRQSVAFKRKRSEARKNGKYDPSSVGKPAAFPYKRNNPEVINWRNPREVPADKFPKRIRIGRRGQVVVIPATRKSVKDQVVPPKEHQSWEEHRECKMEFLAQRTLDAYELQTFVDDEGMEYKELVQVRPVIYSKTDAVKIVRAKPDRLERRAQLKYASSKKGKEEHPELLAAIMEERGAARERKLAAHKALPGDWSTKHPVERKLAMTGKLVKIPNPNAKTDRAWTKARRELKKEQRKKAAIASIKAAA